jgi:hypothetical protein
MGCNFVSSNADGSWDRFHERDRDFHHRDRALERAIVESIQDIIERDRLCSRRANCCEKIHFCTNCPTAWR